jgi:hypothetical protein
MTKFVAALANVSDCVAGDYCDVSVIESEIVGYREDHDGNEIPQYGMTSTVAMDAIETTVRTDADDIAAAIVEADAILRDNGWTRVSDWQAADTAYYADVERD